MSERRPSFAYPPHPAEWFLILTRKQRAEQIRRLPVTIRNGIAVVGLVRLRDHH